MQVGYMQIIQTLNLAKLIRLITSICYNNHSIFLMPLNDRFIIERLSQMHLLSTVIINTAALIIDVRYRLPYSVCYVKY